MVSHLYLWTGERMSTLSDQAGPVRPAARGPAARASDAERDHTAGLLNAAFAEGRLTEAEHAQRLDAAYAARTQPQLRQLIADLPASAPVPRPASGGLTSADRGVFGLLCCLCPPAAIGWWLRSRRRAPGDRNGTLTAAAGADDGRIGAPEGLHAQGR
jgi:hypothetical protein